MISMNKFSLLKYTLSIAAVLTAAFLFVSCSRDSETPEAQVRALIALGEAAAEKKETKVLRDTISEKYSDSQGQDKKAVESILRYYFLRNESIHLLTRIQSITASEPKQMQAIVFVAMAGAPIANSQELENIRASLHRFEITFLQEDGKWRVVRAEWRRAELSDFL